MSSKIQETTSAFFSFFQMSKIMMPLPALTTMAKKLKAKDIIGRKERDTERPKELRRISFSFLELFWRVSRYPRATRVRVRMDWMGASIMP